MQPGEEISRREFLKSSLIKAGAITVLKNLKNASDFPNWIEEIKDEEFKELVEICQNVLAEEEILDLLDIDDLGEALGLVFTMLLEKGFEPEEYLIMKDFLQ